MAHEAIYMTLYFPSQIGEVAEAVGEVVERALALIPEFRLGYAGRRPTGGRFSKCLPDVLAKTLELLSASKDLHDDDSVMCTYKDGSTGTFSANHLLQIYCQNSTYIPSQKVQLQNIIQLYVPPDAPERDPVRMEAILGWFKDAAALTSADYGYVNPVVMYDMLHPARENQEVLDLLRTNPFLDVFDDYNESRHFDRQVKGPMWLSLLNDAHRSGVDLSRLHDGGFIVWQLPNGLTAIQMPIPLGADPSPERTAYYRLLGEAFHPITLDDIHPIMFRFPYRYPVRGSREWLRRFSDGAGTDAWPDDA